METKNTFEKCLELSGTEKEKEFFANKEAQALLDQDDIAYKRLKIQVRAWNTDESGKVWEPNWNDSSRKYSPWLWVDANEENPGGTGFVLSYTVTHFVLTVTAVGSRLCFPTYERAVEFAKTFPDTYKEFWLIPKQ